MVRLPMRPVQPQQEEGKVSRDASPTLDPTAAEPLSLNGVHVLVVDDDADARELVRLVLAGYGADVQTAASADEALAQIERDLPDVLVSDIGLPTEDGYSLIRR